MAEPARSIRQQLGFVGRGWLILAAAGWLAFVATVLMPALPAWLMIGSFFLTCAALLALIFGLRCPRCGTRLTQVGLMAALMPAQTSAQLHCPGCGASLDQSA